MSEKIGVIAEDKSDIEVIESIFEKYTLKNKFSVKYFVGNGCGKLRQKCASWCDLLIKSGCSHVLIFHDLDRNVERALRKEIEGKVSPKKYPNSFIVIPTEELEAWLLSDPKAIKEVFSLEKLPDLIYDCEAVKSPKEHLQKLVWHLGKKRYLNTVHNTKLSKLVSLENLQRCSSYVPFHDYVRGKIFP